MVLLDIIFFVCKVVIKKLIKNFVLLGLFLLKSLLFFQVFLFLNFKCQKSFFFLFNLNFLFKLFLDCVISFLQVNFLLKLVHIIRTRLKANIILFVRILFHIGRCLLLLTLISSFTIYWLFWILLLLFWLLFEISRFYHILLI